MNVLIVEGHSGVAQVLSSYVKLCGHVADEAGNGREALRQLRSSRYDIVITDSEIVSVNGPELCRFVKSHFPDIYVIGMSGYQLALEDFEHAGADICFSKPFDIGLVRKAIDGRISPRGPWRA